MYLFDYNKVYFIFSLDTVLDNANELSNYEFL